MSKLIAEKDLPTKISISDAVSSAYCLELAEIVDCITKSLPVLVECDKELAPYLFVAIRDRLKVKKLSCTYLDGRQPPDANGIPLGIIATMVNQLREAVRGAVEKRVVVIPHLDLLTTSSGGLTTEAKEVIPLLYENPELVWLGFKDPSFSVPKVIECLFARKISIIGTNRNRLQTQITQSESRKFGKTFNPYQLYKYVSGINAVKLRKLLSSIDTQDYPEDPKEAFKCLRNATVTGTVEIPNIDLKKDIGGYDKVKDRLQKEILDILQRRDDTTEESEVANLEELIPKGMIFWGPPGTGKTYFAKAIAAAIGATITIVSGPELKSKWVGESEENLRQIFYQARKSAPSVIVFDELDSFATARGTYTGSGVEHSMVNQLLTEMDGFHKEELVFVIGTTNFVESLDPALLRPGRFEFHLQIPYPTKEDRKAIVEIFNKKMKLQLTEEAIEYAVKKTGEFVTGATIGTRYSGDHINALCRSIARIRLREGFKSESNADIIDRALNEWMEKPKISDREEFILATHEAGHAIVGLHCEHIPGIDKITISSDNHWSFGYVKYSDPAHKYIQTVNFYLDQICMALGAREAEKLLLNDVSMGAVGDLNSATSIAEDLVEVHGLMEGQYHSVQFYDNNKHKRKENISEHALKAMDNAVYKIVEQQRKRAEKIIFENRSMVETLRDFLIKEKTIDAKKLTNLFKKDSK